ncbi:hypothetical protein [Sinorhizobium sp. BJ1]|uniref:hypothetical protein n=1 Tax=Sinorhizobium sp. BJ1 TaxID=2035455 RepID=UPI000BE7976B|nr:hypothetical protein [Sinorhizobium sp. BJ1]PDT81849.1 hypothetical protein CO676_19995 [Sinorhizobium sp. BJ1]
MTRGRSPHNPTDPAERGALLSSQSPPFLLVFRTIWPEPLSLRSMRILQTRHTVEFIAPPELGELTSIVQGAVLLFTLQLHNFGRKQSLDGLSIAVDDDGIMLTPNAFRAPGITAISAKFPHGVETGKVLDAIDDDGIGRCKLVDAFVEMTKVMREPISARRTAQRHLNAFVASLTSST